MFELTHNANNTLTEISPLKREPWARLRSNQRDKADTNRVRESMMDSKQIWADQLRELVERAQREGLSGEVCSACSVLKPVSEFHKNKSRPKGYQAECKLCQNARSQTRNHGMNVDEYNGLLARQKWVCAICGVSSKIKRLHIDHDHSKRCNCENKSCFVCRRGLLCVNCNTALGMFRDDTTIMNNAIAYIERWRNAPK